MALQKRNSLKWVEGEDYDDSGCRDAWRAVVECVWHNGVTNKGLDCDMTCPEPRTPAPSMAPSSTNQVYPTKMPTMPESHLEKCPCSSDWGWDRKSIGNGWADGSGKPGSHEGGADPNDPDHWRCRRPSRSRGICGPSPSRWSRGTFRGDFRASWASSWGRFGLWKTAPWMARASSARGTSCRSRGPYSLHRCARHIPRRPATRPDSHYRHNLPPRPTSASSFAGWPWPWPAGSPSRPPPHKIGGARRRTR